MSAVSISPQVKAKWDEAREARIAAWVAVEDRLSPVIQDLASTFGYQRGVVSQFHVRLGYSVRPNVFEDYQAAVEVCKKHGYEAFGRPTSRDRIHYDETPRGTITILVDKEYYDICMF